MNLKLQLKNDTYVIIEKNTGYGFKLTIFTPTTEKKSKNTHSSKDLFYPNLKQVADKLLWLGLEGESINSICHGLNSHSSFISAQLISVFDNLTNAKAAK
jgi:hypothetical protein